MDQDKIIERLNIVRESLGLNITKFAEMSGISQGNMSAMLNNKRVIGDGILNKISISFDIRKDWLLTGEGEMKDNLKPRIITIEELNELNKGEGVILAYKEGNSIYPIFLNKQDANALNLFIESMNSELQVLKENEYKHIKE